jgi:hypothetical protein
MKDPVVVVSHTLTYPIETIPNLRRARQLRCKTKLLGIIFDNTRPETIILKDKT